MYYQHENNFTNSLNIRDLLAVRHVLKAKIKYYYQVAAESTDAQITYARDYDLCVKAAEDTAYADEKILHYNMRLQTINALIVKRAFQTPRNH